MEKSENSRDITETIGCGTDLVTPSITLNINTTTGGNFAVVVESHNSVEILKKIVSKKLKVSKDRICLLHRERELLDGTLKDNGLMDGSKIILIPNVETGLLAQRPENTVMQALESLNDTQVNDFLSGKSPLNLSMRLGDHMMLIQLQLSTLNPSSPHGIRSRTKPKINTSSPTIHFAPTPSATTSTATSSNNDSPQRINDPDKSIKKLKRQNSIDHENNATQLTTTPINSHESPSASSRESEINTILFKREIENLQNIVKSLTEIQRDKNLEDESIENDKLLEQSPIKSLSNLVSSPIKTTSIKNIPIENFSPSPSSCTVSSSKLINVNPSTSSSSSSCPDPISAKLTSCLCKSLDTHSISNNVSCETNCQLKQEQASYPSTSTAVQNDSSSKTTASTETKSWRTSLLHKTANNVIIKSKSKSNTNVLLKRTNNQIIANIDNQISATFSDNSNNSSTDSVMESEDTVNGTTIIDSCALAEASRNLTQTLRKLSKEVFTNKIDVAEDNSRRMGTGAVIESMKNHGRGIYSGTFSGTLNPALQDRNGRPKRDISTIIHILNDLLSAAPQYRRGTKIKFETSNSHRNAIKEVPRTRHTQSQTDQESCSNCSHENKSLNSSSSLSCPYGECKGHLNSSNNGTGGKIVTNKNCHKHSSHHHLKTCSYKESTSISSSLSALNQITIADSLDDTTLKISCRCNSSSTTTINNYLHNTDNENVFIDDKRTNITCNKCSNTEIENNKTKCKLDHLRLVMQQKKENREARKLKTSPYSKTTRLLGGSSTSSTITSADVPTNLIVEEVDAAA